MAKQEVPLQQLSSYLPNNSFEDVFFYLQQHKVHLTITKKRQSVLGDYRNAGFLKNHRISVNGNLNKYAFLITLLHELAHLFTYEKYKNVVAPHGKQWQNEFSKILATFLLKKIFPIDIEKALLKTIQQPSASSCADESLMRVLYKYDERPINFCLVESLTIGDSFIINDKRIFKVQEKLRKRFKCIEVKTGKIYLFSGVYEVEKYG